MAFKIVQVDRQPPMFQQSIQLDLSRATAILYRQSRRGSDKVHIESRMLQESLKPFVVVARGEDSDENIHIFDEGAGVSGTKGIDKRKKLQELHIEIASNLIGDIVLARPDRLFRDKHFANVSTFTQLAEKMKIKVIVPTDKGVIVYDFTKEKDLQAFQEAMIQAYAYIVNQIGYMNRARAFKVSKGLYGGGTMPLPYVLLRDMPKEEQVQVIYDPWQKEALDLFKKFTEFNFESGRIARYVEDKQYLFQFMSPQDLEKYQPVTTMTKINGGYTFGSIDTLLDYLSNLSLAGFAYGGRDSETGDTILIPNAFDAAIPLDLLEPCYAAIKGEYLDGTPFHKNGKARQYRRTTLESDALLHGLLTSDQGSITVFGQYDRNCPVYLCRKGGYLGHKSQVGLGRSEYTWGLSAHPFDSTVLDRLIALCEYDNTIVERVKAYFGEKEGQGQSTLEVLDTAIKNTQDAIIRVGKTIVNLTKGLVDDQGNPIALPENDPNIKEQRDLYMQLRRLQKQREKAAEQANEDPSKSITGFYDVLSHVREQFYTRTPQDRKDIMRKLIEEIKVNYLSAHLFTLHIKWIEPLATRSGDDVALLWRNVPTKNDETATWTPAEEEALVRLYPKAARFDLLQAMPSKSLGQIKNRASELSIRRDGWHCGQENYAFTITYNDLLAAAAFTETVKERQLLWRKINELALQTKRREIRALWFLPVDMISFSASLVTDLIENDPTGRTLANILPGSTTCWHLP